MKPAWKSELHPQNGTTPETAVRVPKGQEVTRAPLHPFSRTQRAVRGRILMMGASKGWGQEQFAAPEISP